MGEIQTSKNPLRRIAVVALGWSLVIGGAIGLLLPVIPGWLLIVLGALVLSTEHPWLRRLLQKLRVRFPAVRRGLNRVSSWRESWRRPFRMSDSRNSRSRCEL
jgi:uncharacterized membrane protein YbaN (DUF454 family)